MAFVNHKRVKVGDVKPTALCGAKNWLSLVNIDNHVDCKKCLKKMNLKKQ
jgi:hypothetical protein